MPLLSAFTPFGLLEFSSAPSEAEKIYRSLVNNYRDPATGKPTLDLSPGTHQEAKVYAWAMAIADASMATRQAGRELIPESAYYQLADQEAKYQIVPGPNDSIATRRAMLALRRKLARGPRYEAMVDGLRTLLGANFLGYRPITIAEAEILPENPDAGPGVFARPELASKSIRLLSATARPTTTATVVYETWNPKHTDVELAAGDVLAVDPGVWGLAEKVTVVDAWIDADGVKRFSAIFANPHEAKTFAATGAVPLWASTKRHVMIIVRAAVAVNPTVRAQVNEFLRRVMRAPTSWAIVQPADEVTPAMMGPFALGVSPLGAVPVELMPTMIPGVLPRIDSIANANGRAIGNTNGQGAYFTGSGFSLVTEVWFGDVPAVTFTATSDGTMSAIAKGQDGVTVPVRLVTANGQTVKPNAWTFADTPNVSGVTPNHGDQLGGTPITISGSHFLSAVAASGRLAGAASIPLIPNLSSFLVVNDTTITAVTPAKSDTLTPDLFLSTDVGLAIAPSGVFAYDAAVVVTLGAISTDLVDTAGGEVITVLGTTPNMAGAVLQTSPDNATWTSCASTSSTTTTATGTTVGPLTTGPVYVRALVGGVPSSNQILIEAWAPQIDPDVTLVLDPKSNPYNAGTGTWVPRYTTIVGATFGPVSGSTAYFASDGAGGFVAPGLSTSGLTIGLASINGQQQLFLGADPGGAGAGQLPGSIAAVFSSQTIYGGTLAAYQSAPYNQPGIVTNAGQGTLGVDALVVSDDTSHRIAAHNYGLGYTTLTVAKTADASIHAVVHRWTPDGSLPMDLSVDGALSGADYASVASAVGTNAVYAGSQPITLASRYPGAAPVYQQYRGVFKALVWLKARASATFVSKFRKWSIVRCGAVGAPPLGTPWLTTTLNASGVASDFFDTLGGDVVTVRGVSLSGLTGVTLGGTTIAITPISATTFTFVMPAKARGSYALVATNAVGPSLPIYVDAWDPSGITNVDTYLDSRRGVSVTGTAINSVTDQSPVANGLWAPYLGAGTGGAPNLVANTFGSKPGIVMAPPGANNVISISQALIAPGGGARRPTPSMFAGVKWTDTDTTLESYAGNPPLTLFGDTTGSIQAQFGASAGVLRRMINSAGWTTTDRGAGLNDGVARMVGLTFDQPTNTNKIYVGSALQGTAFVQAPSGGTAVSAIGGGYGGDALKGYDGWRGSIAWAVLALGVMSDADIAKLAKWSSQTFGTL